VNFNDLLEYPIALKLQPHTSVLFELDDLQVRELKGMPSILYHGTTAEEPDFYAIPPIKYPNGKTYLTMGLRIESESYLSTLEDFQNWLSQDTPSRDASRIEKIFKLVFPGITPRSIEQRRTVHEKTSTGLFFLGEISPGRFVVTGGNGNSDRSSDEIGFIVAHKVMKTSFRYDIALENFSLKFET